MSDELAEIETRLSAIEIFICHTLSNCLINAGQADQMDRIHRDLLRRVDRADMQDLSPMYAERNPGDLGYAVRCLISMQRRILGLRSRLQP